MSVVEDLASSLDPTLTELFDAFGIHLTVYRATEVTALDGTTSRTYVADSSLTDVVALFNTVSTAVRERTFGQRSVASASLTMSRVNGVVPMLGANDAVKLLSGPFSALRFVVEQPSLADGLGLTCVVPLVLAPSGVVLP